VMCFPQSSFWVRMAPVANAEVLTCRKKGHEMLGWWRDGLERIMVMRVSSTLEQWCPEEGLVILS
jgi:hypothetical protein